MQLWHDILGSHVLLTDRFLKRNAKNAYDLFFISNIWNCLSYKQVWKGYFSGKSGSTRLGDTCIINIQNPLVSSFYLFWLCTTFTPMIHSCRKLQILEPNQIPPQLFTPLTSLSNPYPTGSAPTSWNWMSQKLSF